MKFFRRASGHSSNLGILPGTFNPVTIAHLALAHAALAFVDEVVFVLPRAFPHKPYSGASFEQRIELLQAALADEPAFSIASTDGGLFLEIARECREVYGAETRLSFICGRDAAERIIAWDYADPLAVPAMLQEFDLLVADRDGEYHPPAEHSHAIRRLTPAPESHPVSATEVRERMALGQPWEHLVPSIVVDLLRRIYATIEAGSDSPRGT
jgi:nicotinate-nucleotide adenylyltransferase